MRRAAAGHRGRVLRRPPHPRAATRGALRRGWRRGERPRAPPAPADAERRPGDRQRSHLPGHDGAGHDAVLPRETRPSGEAEAGTLPRLGGAGHLRPVHAEAGLRCKPRGRHAQLAGRSAGAAPLRRHRPGYQDPPLDRLSLRCAGPSGPAERGVRPAGPRDREAGGRLPRRGPRPCEAQEAWPQDEEGAQPIPYRLEGTEAPHPVRRRRRRATVSDVGPDHRRHAPGTGGGLRPAGLVSRICG